MRLLLISSLVLFSMAALCAESTNSTNMVVRPISLQESIEMAIRSNLGVELERINTGISRYTVNLAYGDYDPALSASGSHNFSSTPSGFDAQGRPIFATRSESDSFAANLGPGGGVAGLLPSGLTYNLSGNASDTTFRRLDTNNTIFETSRGAVTLNLRQPVLKNFWIDTTRLNIKVAKNRSQWAELNLRSAVMNVVNNVAQAYYELIFTRQNIDVFKAALDLANKLVAENKKRVQVGTLAPLDEKQAESQAASSEADLLKAQNDAVTQQNVLKALLTGNFTSIHDTELIPTEVLAAPAPVLNLQQSWATAMQERPDLLQSRLDLERQNIMIRYSYNQLFPQLDLIGSYGFTGSGKEFSDAFGQISEGSGGNYSFGAAVTFPLGNRAARANYKISQEQKRAALIISKTLEQKILIDIDNGVKQVRNASEQIEARRQARIYAETALEAEQKKLESGKSTSFQVLQFQKDLTSSRSAEIRALADFNKALSQLYFLEGSILERNHIKVE